jgi:hypothetical protein
MSSQKAKPFCVHIDPGLPQQIQDVPGILANGADPIRVRKTLFEMALFFSMSLDIFSHGFY